MNFILSFSPISIGDQTWIRPIVCASGTRNADFSFVNIFAWSKQYEQRVALIDGCFVGEVTVDGSQRYSYPLGASTAAQERRVLDALLESRNGVLTLSGVSSVQLEALRAFYPERVTAEAQTDLFDYIYDAEKMASFAGKKLHAKRNFVNRFTATYPNYIFEPLTETNAAECLLTDGLWLYDKGDDAEFDEIAGESSALEACIVNFPHLNADGGIIRLEPGGAVAAFAIGERLSSDTFVTHFEKALTAVEGSYQIINRDFTRYVLEKYPDVRFINREDDMGLDNLRKAKRSYYPEFMEEKYLVIVNSE